MTGNDLEKLASLKASPPAATARDRAVFAAVEAFDQANTQKGLKETQETVTGNRPISISIRFWRFLMNTIVKPFWTMKPAAMAAVSGAIMLPLAGVITWNVLQPDTAPLPAEILLETPDSTLADARVRVSPPNTRRNNSGSRATQEADQALIRPLPAKPATRAKRQTKRRLSVQYEGSRPSKPVIVPQPTREAETERYTTFDDNPLKTVVSSPVSTFSIDVDTASYARVRAMLNAGNLPPKDMVRVEEMINYFSYDYDLPSNREQPFKPTITVMPTPWNKDTRLMHIGIKGFDIEKTERPKANLVFLLDVSGSMNQPDKLPLLVKSFRLLLQKLNASDTVSIVTYAGRAATVLEPTVASQRSTILGALENLRAGGSTGGAQGIEEAYRLAAKSFVDGGVNRVMLATDGDFNVGISDPEQLKDFISEKRDSGIFLSVFGFGTGNYNDALMQALAQNGNGSAAYIDTLAEAQKTLIEEAGSTLFPIATDVKIQMEFNPAKIAEYRLIGYETRALKREDFNNDKVDAGDIGAGHSVTAIYELTPVGSPAVLNEPLRYSRDVESKPVDTPSREIGFLKMRYKLPGETKSRLITIPVEDAVSTDPSADARFASAVAAFGQKLRSHTAVDDMSYEAIAELAAAARGADPFGYRTGFVQLVRLTAALDGSQK